MTKSLIDCPHCGNKMTELFYSVVCDFCTKPRGMFYHGYILWTIYPDMLWEVQEHPVFRYRTEVLKWQQKQYSSTDFEARDVLCLEPYFWIEMYGSKFTVADTRFRVTKDVKDIKNKVYLTDKKVKLPDIENIYIDDKETFGLNW